MSTTHDTAAAEPRAVDDVSPALRAMAESIRTTAVAVVGTGARRPRAQEAPREDAEAEAVHDFRVAIRRLRTVLRGVRGLYGKRRIKLVSIGLKRYADATGRLRDEEVLRETVAALELDPAVRTAVDEWSARRRRQEKVHRAGVVRLLRAEIESALGTVLAELEAALVRGPARSGDVLTRDLQMASIERACRDVRDAVHVDPTDSAAMHALRILFKRLRYTAELFLSLGTGPPSEELAALAKGATRMQKRLGDLHDIDEALIKIGRAWGLGAEARAAIVVALREARKKTERRSMSELEEIRRTHPRLLGSPAESAP